MTLLSLIVPAVLAIANLYCAKRWQKRKGSVTVALVVNLLACGAVYIAPDWGDTTKPIQFGVLLVSFIMCCHASFVIVAGIFRPKEAK